MSEFTAVYGPVQSWRYGRSLGIDPIGETSTCSFDCAYCQLGEIEHRTGDRQRFVETDLILRQLESFAPWDVDVITLSGSGEPTLALNLGDIIRGAKSLSARPVAVLTNGVQLGDRQVAQDLQSCDFLSIKLDAISPAQLRRVNRPVAGIDLPDLWKTIHQFRQTFSGHLAVQTMLLTPWSDSEQSAYIDEINALQPDEIQLNTPTRPKPVTRQLDGRGNHLPGDRPYDVRYLKPVSPEILQTFRDRIVQETGISVRSPQLGGRVDG